MKAWVPFAVVMLLAVVWSCTKTFDPLDVSACLDTGMLDLVTCEAMRDFELAR